MTGLAIDPNDAGSPQQTELFDSAQTTAAPRAWPPVPMVVTAGLAPGTRALERGRARLVVLAALFVLGFVAVSAKLVDATVMATGRETASRGAGTVAAPAASRADILDRNGVLLATSVATQSVYADPKLVIDPAATARRLKTVMPEMDEADIAARLAGERRFVWIRRNVTPKQVNDVNRLGLPGVFFQREERRIYPLGTMASHVVGFTGVDNHGLMGIEQGFDKHLRGSGTPLQLSLDIRINHILRRELQAQIKTFSAIGGGSLVMDVKTGEVLGMVSLPDFDPNAPAALDEETRFNRMTLGVYEMGSTFKILNTAMALESGKVRIADVFDAGKPIQYGRFTINDFRGANRPLNVAEIMQHSSNIGSARMAQVVGVDFQREFMRRIGMLRPAPIELPEVGGPMAPNPWREINMMTIAFGHGVAVSPLQLSAAVAGISNGGIMQKPTMLKLPADAATEGQRIVSPQTSDTLRRVMRLAVTSGSGINANTPGYLVGGKTGTAEKNKGRAYSQNARLSSFIGAFPMTDPRYLVLVMVDEPKGTKQSFGFATGGWVAAPAVARIVQQIGPLLGVQPVDDTRPDIVAATSIDPKAPRQVPVAPTTIVPAAATAATVPAARRTTQAN
jgi:cell division protein FtsI (penicillin-binding protein 3)